MDFLEKDQKSYGKPAKAPSNVVTTEFQSITERCTEEMEDNTRPSRHKRKRTRDDSDSEGEDSTSRHNESTRRGGEREQEPAEAAEE